MVKNKSKSKVRKNKSMKGGAYRMSDMDRDTFDAVLNDEEPKQRDKAFKQFVYT